MLLLHGHLGNENVMWIFARKLPKDIIMLAPRAPQKLGPDQFSWHAITPTWPDLRTTYAELTKELLNRVDRWVNENGLDVQKYDLMGFSQGAVMAYALSFLHPEKINKVAALAGFIPHSWQKDLTEKTLADRSYFVSNGTEDEVIPIEQARQSLDWLKEKGAQVTYCEGHTGHKLSASCFGGLGEYFHSPSTD
jgi:phospholipase/carboxylesterase